MTDDGSIRARWQSSREPPVVFIIGLHRSGTTFLYESMSRVFPVAKLTVRDVVDFDRLVQSHLADGGRSGRQALDEYFARHRASKRANDALPLSASTAEEYGWILKRKRGSYETKERTIETLRDVVRKLAFIHPEADALLLKNPWDTGNAPYLARQFENAKFVFIRREPIEILNSELGNALYFTRGSDALLQLLTRGVTSTRLFILFMKALRAAVGARRFTTIALRLLTADVIGKLRAYEAALAAMPAGRAFEVSYRELVGGPRETLLRIGAFLGLAASGSIETIAAERREGGLAPAVLEHEERLRARLLEAGLVGSGGGS